MEDSGALVVQTTGSGRGGDIVVEVGKLVLESNARIDSSTRSASPIPAAGGNIRVTATESIEISGRESDTEFSGITTLGQPESTGDAGTIEISAPRITIKQGGEVSAKALGTGNAGRVLIIAGDTFQILEGSVTTSSENASGGQVEIQAKRQVYLRNSEVTTSVLDGAGGGGDVSIDPQFVVLDSSRVVANAVQGAGGNISIRAGQFIASADSRVDASSALGIDGNVEVDSPDTDISGQLAALPSTYADPAALLRDSCAARGSSASTFMVAPRERSPAPPDAPFDGPLDPPPGCQAP
jgi:large exoprotein involved in heme utilization and adhesion